MMIAATGGTSPATINQLPRPEIPHLPLRMSQPEMVTKIRITLHQKTTWMLRSFLKG